MKLFRRVVVPSLIFGLLLGLSPVHAAKKIEIINLSGSPIIDQENPVAETLITAKVIDGEVLTNKQSRRLARNGLRVRVRAPKQSGVKLTPNPNRVTLVFDPETQTFNTAKVFYIPTQNNQ